MKSLAAPALVSLLVLLSGAAAAAQWADPHPAEASVRYPRGEAPFYVRVRSYARQLERGFERNASSIKQYEMDALGVDATELEAIYIVLSGHDEREDAARMEGWRQECIPMLRGDAITEAQARAAFVRRDDIAWREEVAEQTLKDLENRSGAAIAEKVRQRIISEGEHIDFTRSDWTKTIELGRGGLFVSHMMIECGTHPDYPKR
jgi:hypothetical protein